MSKQLVPCFDFLGKEINVGDTIVYPGRRGSTMWMVKSRVVSVARYKDPLGRDLWSLEVQHPSGATRIMTNIQRVVVVTSLEN